MFSLGGNSYRFFSKVLGKHLVFTNIKASKRFTFSEKRLRVFTPEYVDTLFYTWFIIDFCVVEFL
jgi:hypothetical protein